jgi:hypothetical protein
MPVSSVFISAEDCAKRNGGSRLGADGPSRLVRAGIDTVEDVSAMSDAQLIAIDGIGPKTLKDIRKELGGNK